MPRCGACGTSCSAVEAYTCSLCEQVHCVEHRLPEKHDCPLRSAATPPEFDEPPDVGRSDARDPLSDGTETSDRSSESDVPASSGAGDHPDDTTNGRDVGDRGPTGPVVRTHTCDYCGGEADEVHRCDFCGGTHCRVHGRRLQHDCFDDPSPDVSPDGTIERSNTVDDSTEASAGETEYSGLPARERVRIVVLRVLSGLSTVVRVGGILVLFALSVYGVFLLFG